jgi:hypothetical protein
MMSLGFDPRTFRLGFRLGFKVDKVAMGAGVFPRTWVRYCQCHSFSVS